MTRHIPVLLQEVIEALNLEANKNVIDCTLGDAGHSEMILEKTAPNGKLLGIDADPESLLRSKQYLYRFEGRTVFARDNFENIKKIVVENQFEKVDAILADFGWSSPQFAERNRGFSFEGSEPLDMRYGGANQKTPSAAEILKNYTEKELSDLFTKYGEEDLSKKIAEAIILKRKEKEIETSGELTELILETYRKVLKTDKEIPWVGGLHPATKVYQALRIEVNNELGVIKKFLPDALDILEKGGRMAIITFHSLEDRIVKHFFQANSKKVKLINKKPLIAGDEEQKNNPRSRSAKLRIIEKI